MVIMFVRAFGKRMNVHSTIYQIVPGRRRMRDVPLRQRPRELFERIGAENIPDDVLLALLLRSGTRGVNVSDLAQQLLKEYGSLTMLAQVSTDELSSYRGMGKAKAQVLKASLELAKRLAEEQMPEQPSVHTPKDVADILRERIRTREEEAFRILLLDTKNRLKGAPKEMSKGTLNASLVHPREVFRGHPNNKTTHSGRKDY